MTSRSQPEAAFAHASEAELARILDFYRIRWEYEPHAYPILWSMDGRVQESFAPDFYLPDLDLYVELTTLKQSLVRKKNRKLRRLRELYPDIRIKLFYARDFRALMLKYGRLAVADELSGTIGQVGSSRPEPGPSIVDAVPGLEMAAGTAPRGALVPGVPGSTGALPGLDARSGVIAVEAEPAPSGPGSPSSPGSPSGAGSPSGPVPGVKAAPGRPRRPSRRRARRTREATVG